MNACRRASPIIAIGGRERGGLGFLGFAELAELEKR